MATTRTAGTHVVARETVVITVGATPPVRRRITVTDRRTGDRVEIDDTDNDPIEPGDMGTPYTFKAGERVPKNHPAVKDSPGSFISEDEANE